MKITKPKIIEKNGFPLLQVTIDGKKAFIQWEQKTRPYGIIFLGSAMASKVSASIPADPADGRQNPIEVPGGTDDPEIVALFDRYMAMMNNDEPLVFGPISAKT